MSRSERAQLITVAAIAFPMLTVQFLSNPLQVADPDWFQSHQRDGESLVIGRLVQSRDSGPLSASALTLLGSDDADAPVRWMDSTFEFQFRAYEEGLAFANRAIYRSHPGGQALVLSMLDRVVRSPPADRLKMYRALTAALTALTLTGIVMWFLSEFGGITAAAVLVTTALSPWVIVFGRNLYWSLWAFFLPMLLVLVYLARHPLKENSAARGMGMVIALGVVVKCLFTGFEFITTALLMAVTPLVYFAVRDGTPFPKFAKAMGIASLASLLSVGLVVGVLSLQIGLVAEDPLAGIQHVIYSFHKRSYPDPASFPQFSRESAAAVSSVIWEYMRGSFLDLTRWISAPSTFISQKFLNIRYAHLVVLFAVASAFVLLPAAGRQSTRYRALVAATWFSLLAPLSWFVIFKAHAVRHMHMDFVVWHMPYVLLGFALTGCAATLALRLLLGRKGP